MPRDELGTYKHLIPTEVPKPEQSETPEVKKTDKAETSAFDAIKDEDIEGWTKKPEEPRRVFNAAEVVEEWRKQAEEQQRAQQEGELLVKKVLDAAPNTEEIGRAAVEAEVQKMEAEAARATPETERVEEVRRVEVKSAPEVQAPGDANFHHSLTEIKEGDIGAPPTPSHSIFSRIGAHVERMGINLANAPKYAALEFMYNWRNEHAIEATKEYIKQEKEITKVDAELEKKIKELDGQIELARTTGHYDTKTAMEVDKQRAKLVNKRDEAKTSLKKAHKNLEHWNGKKTTWENRIKNVADNTMAGVDKRLQPSRDAFAELARQKESVGKEIEKYKAGKELGQSKLAELRARLATNPLAPEKAEIRAKLQAIEAVLGRIEDKYKEYTKEQGRIGVKMNKANTYIGEWNVMREEQLGITNKDRRYFNPGLQKQSERGPNREYEHSHAPNTNEQEPAAPSGATSETAGEYNPQPEENRESAQEVRELKIDLNTYLQKWNGRFGKDGIQIDPKVFAETFKIKQDVAMPTKTFEDAIVTMLTTGVTGYRLELMKSGIENHFKTLKQDFTQTA